ncbi:EAL domain-containing protein [Bermanella marisrubri]|uniref:Signaling repeat/GGDEF domain/EAL domain protein n=1 Tax=Bermanella marisrubri TaxID=207949 RepID=Q1N2C7_9GAMM|nr:EAL domain-containing protein [Bermanella marisrubri]EAT12480.1 signaling repeat/GGDEF domain/EAL domain protein [Oceanobacter sp. RED65] [Bermanella marisrubri]QIZ85557.1 EAL domain-containing protein [Bermanella marisrubri]
MREFIIACLVFVCVTTSHAQSDFLYIDGTSVALPSPLPSTSSRATTPPESMLNAGYSYQAYAQSIKPSSSGSWHKIRLINPGNETLRRYLVFDVHILKHLNVYLFDRTDLRLEKKLGLKDISEEEVQDYTAPHLEFSILPKSQLTLLIYKQNDGPGIFPARILSEQEWLQEKNNKRFFWGAIIAVLIAMALYNVLVYSMHPNKSYGWYLTFHTVCFFYFSALNGFGFHLWPLQIQVMLATNIMFMNFLLIILIANFANHFLFANQNAPRHHKLVLPLSIIAGLGCITSLFVPEYSIIPAFSILQAFASIFGMSIGIASLKSGFKPAKYFVISWACTLAGAGIGMATVLDAIAINIFTLHAFLIGTLGELFLLSIGLASRMKYFEMRSLSQSYLYPNTNLGNLSYFSQRLPQNLPEILKNHQHVYLVLMNLTGFREVVSLYGPKALTESYQQRTIELENLLRNEKWSIHFTLPSGRQVSAMALPSEQILLLVNVNHHDEIELIVDKLYHHSHRDLRIRNIHMPMSSTISYVHISHHHSLQEQYRKAQVALQHAIVTNQKYCAYSPSLDLAIGERITLIQKLHKAITEDELDIFLQPQFSLFDNKLVGAEALVRWRQNDGHFISPGVFIPLAEQTGLIFEISKNIIARSFAWLSDIKKHHPNLYQNFNLSINLSALDMAQSSLLSFLQTSLFNHDLNANKITLEITESAIMENHDLFIKGIQELQTLGFNLAIDDFGTGYSSMLYLKELKAKEIKIDMGFVRGIHTNRVNQKIVQAIVQLANGTDSMTVAEGVECKEEALWLQSIGCDFAQGYYWNPALPIQEFYTQYVSLKL